jgi:hypothetical protein
MRVVPILAVLALILTSGPLAAETARWSAPRRPDGHPDLQGVWSNKSLTRLTRAPGNRPLVVSEGEARAMVAPLLHYMAQDLQPTDPSKGAPAYGEDPGGANGFWGDMGRSLAKVDGQYRTSWIADPADGQLPLSERGRALVAQAMAFARAADAPSDPERLQPWDRCIIANRGSGGPAMLNNIYNTNYQFVQTPDHLVITAEMIHDVRIVPIFATKAEAQAGHGPLERWLGDSTGWWEGDTLVVETTRVHHEQGRAGPVYLTPQGRVTERFRRIGPTELSYTFTVEDPTYYSRPWRAEMVFNASDRLYEYACHEGNYALPHILAGARVKEGRKLGG